MSRIEVREERKDRYCVLRIDTMFDPENLRRGFQARVTAYAEQDFSFESNDYHWKRATISWYSVGSASPEEAEAYAKAITLAIEYARKMDVEHGFTVVTGKV
jgi:hypothetical protein